MTLREKKDIVLIWLTKDIFAQAPNNTEDYIASKIPDRYTDLKKDSNWALDLNKILETLFEEGNVGYQDREVNQITERWYQATPKGKALARELLSRADVLKYVKMGGGVKNKLTPLETTDRVLEWFCMDINEVLEESLSDSTNRVDRQFVTQHQASRAVIDHFIKDGLRELDSTEFVFYYPLIIEKLKKDKYITYYEDTLRYSQNIEGVIFMQNGGYRGQNQEKNRAERRVRISQILTWILAVGVYPPFWWYLLDILRNYYNPLFLPFRNFVFPFCTSVGLICLIYTIQRQMRRKIQ